MNNPKILIFYRYIEINRPRDIMIQQRAICHELGIRGRILIAREGINGTVEGSADSLEKYARYMDSHKLFRGMKLKDSPGTGQAFPKLIVKVRSEIVTGELGNEDINPNEISGKYLSAEELQSWFEQGKNFKIVDMRNDYEQFVGMFENSIASGMETFKDLKKVPQKLEPLKDEVILTVCTSGVRCEKASGYLKSKGFKEIYQLEDGIASYMQKFPNQKFKGSLYVFDNRITVNFDDEKSGHEIIGKCGICNDLSENYVNCSDDECHKHFICCKNCLVNGKAFCSEKCKIKILQNA